MEASDATSGSFDELFILDRICREFELAWQEGETPEIEPYLTRIPPEMTAEVFAELLALELDYRSSRGELLTIDDYLQRFPTRPEAITEVWKAFDRTWCPLPPGAGRARDSYTPTQGACPPDPGPEPFPDIPEYRFLERLGQGGMGVVYKAEHQRLGRFVAVKMIAPMNHLPATLKRFQAEAEALAGLQHPNIVQLFEARQHAGRPYFTLEYVEGGNLKSRLKEHPPTPNRAAEIVATLARAIHHAHTLGIVHRDLKPSNVLVKADGQLKITDFGLVKLAAPDLESTRTGEIIGSPLYMSPEQASGRVRDVGPVSDVYSLGVILYELLVGHVPFRGDSVLDVLHQVKSVEPVPPRRLRPDLPRDLDSICLHCLEKDPGRRYGSADALADDLERYLQGRSIIARQAGNVEQFGKWVWRNPLIAAMVALMFFLGVTAFALVTWQWWEASHQRDLADLRLGEERRATGRAENALRQADLAKQAALQAQGRADQERDRAELARYAIQIQQAVRQLEDGFIGHAPTNLASCDPRYRGWEHGFLQALCDRRASYLPAMKGTVEAVAISPDGHFVAGGSATAIQVWERDKPRPVLSLPVQKRPPGLPFPQRTIPTGWIEKLLFSPDSKQLAVIDWVVEPASGRVNSSIQVWDVARRKKVFAAEESLHKARANAVGFAADSKRLAVGVDTVIKIWDIEAGNLLHTLRGESGRVRGLAFHPDGKGFAGSFEQLKLIIWDLSTGQVSRTLGLPRGSVSTVGFPPDGKTVLGVAARDLRRWGLIRFGIRRMSFPMGSQRAAALGGENHFLAVSGSLKEVDLHHVQIFDVEKQQHLMNLEGEGSAVTSLGIDTRGATLVTNGAGSRVKLWHLSEKGLETRKLQRTNNRLGSEVVFAGAGMVAFGGGPTGKVEVLDAQTMRPMAVIQESADALALSPDGKFLATAAFTPDARKLRTDRSGSLALWRLDTGTCIRRFPGHPASKVHDLLFLGDGARLASCSEDSTVKLWDVATGEETATFRGHRSQVISLAATSDGQYLASSGLDDKAITIWDSRTLEVKHTLHGHRHPVWDMAFAPDNQSIATSSERALKLWDVETGEDRFEVSDPLRKAYHRPGGFRPDRPFFRGLTFTPDGTRLANASVDGRIIIWETTQGQTICTLNLSRGQINHLAFSGDGAQLAAITNFSVLRLLGSPAER